MGEVEEAENSLLDVRPEPAFLAGHAQGAVGIALEELSLRVHELPPRDSALTVMDADPSRAERAATWLRERGHGVNIASFNPDASIELGPTRARLWRPNAFLIEALQRIASENRARAASPPRALDVACGSGRDAVYLALAGYEVEAIDNLPDALEKAADLARRSGVTICTIQRDLKRDPSLAVARYDLVTVFRFLQRSLMPALRGSVAPRGYLAYETFHARNLETGRRPLSPDHLLNDGELAARFEGFETLIARAGIEREGRFFSCWLGRRQV